MKPQLAKVVVGAREPNERQPEEGNDYEELDKQAPVATDRDGKALPEDANNVHKVSLDTLRDQIFKMNKVIDSIPGNHGSQNALPIPDKQSENRLSNISQKNGVPSNQQHISSPSLATTNQTDEQMQRNHLNQIKSGVANNTKVGSKRAIRSN